MAASAPNSWAISPGTIHLIFKKKIYLFIYLVYLFIYYNYNSEMLCCGLFKTFILEFSPPAHPPISKMQKYLPKDCLFSWSPH